ncbi:hypothetical protein [Agromyces laixinhei]|uniref:hypothetical protein n=1 Tax=Agromyces laixinhei TaxID=2585717 RepID=UPI001115EF67|nr:hypothetical protein [Agromyces laixinhei]
MTETPLGDHGHLVLVLDYLGHELEPSILIGGWATFFRVGGDISHDIDLIIGSPEVRERVRSAVDGVSESRHLQGRKWRGEVEGIHVDVYLPHESELGGKLRLKVEVLAEYTDELGHGAWRLLTIEAHTISKLAALLDRPDSEKGFKDAREIWRLLEQGVDARVATRILAAATAGQVDDLRAHIATAFELLPSRAGLNKEQRRRIDRLRREWDDAIVAAVAPIERARPTLE